MLELSAHNICKNLGGQAILKGISLTLGPGEIIALLGQSGSGKTTLLRSIAGLETPEDGSIVLDGVTLFDSTQGINVPAEKRGFGLVFQSYALWPHRTVYDNVAYGLVLRGTQAAETVTRVSDVLDRLGIGHCKGRYPHEISGGQQQRVALARALVYRPPVLLLDEPLSNLDAKLREEARGWLRELIQQLQLSAVYVTHDQVEAMAVADRVLFLRDGLIEQQGTPREIYQEPATAVAADFMGANNVLNGRISTAAGGVSLQGLGWLLAGRARGPVENGQSGRGFVRVERTAIAREQSQNAVAVELSATLFLGERYEYIMHTPEMTLRAWGRDPLALGKYWVRIDPEDLWLFPG
jgi:iron(III) transport system ATP-binding protein